jgi:hypothetical protein
MRLALAAAVALAAAATGPAAADTPEPGSSEAIRAASSDARFVSAWVASVPESAEVPSPSDHFGRIAGAPGELTYSEQAYAYYRALAKASPRVRVESLGRSEEGREILLVAIADEAGLRAGPARGPEGGDGCAGRPAPHQPGRGGRADTERAPHLLFQRRAAR